MITENFNKKIEEVRTLIKGLSNSQDRIYQLLESQLIGITPIGSDWLWDYIYNSDFEGGFSEFLVEKGVEESEIIRNY